jgi:hypothetical protein
MAGGQSADPSGKPPSPTDPVAEWNVPAHFTPPPIPPQPGPPPMAPQHTPPLSMSPPSRRRMAWLPGLVVLVLAILIATSLTVWPGMPDRDPGREGEDSGRGAIGLAPSVPGGSATTVPGTSGGNGANQGTAAPGSSQSSGTQSVAPTLSTGPGLRRGSLVVTSQIVGVVTYSVQITIRNDGETTEAWHSIALRLEPLTLGVTATGNVSDAPVGDVHCLVPAGGSSALAPGQSVMISASVLGALTKATVGLDEPPCPA